MNFLKKYIIGMGSGYILYITLNTNFQVCISSFPVRREVYHLEL